MKDHVGDITARRLTIVDDKGNPRIILSTENSTSYNDIPRITMRDKNGHERITITIEDHPLICITHTDGSTAVGLAEVSGEGGSLAINDHTGKRAIELAANGPYGRCVIVFDENHKSVGSVP